MSLIQTCSMAGENPFDYLSALHKNPSQVAENPERRLAERTQCFDRINRIDGIKNKGYNYLEIM